MKRAEFFERTNGQCRRRLFDKSDWRAFCAAKSHAAQHAAAGKPYYRHRDAGGVANNYGNMTTTARWGVWVDPETHRVVEVVGRAPISGRHVPCAYYGGERAYEADWNGR